MAHQLKIYRGNKFVAACKYAEDAAVLAGLSPGTEVRFEHKKKHTLFIEPENPQDGQISAARSWDEAAEAMRDKYRELFKDSPLAQTCPTFATPPF